MINTSIIYDDIEITDYIKKNDFSARLNSNNVGYYDKRTDVLKVRNILFIKVIYYL